MLMFETIRQNTEQLALQFGVEESKVNSIIHPSTNRT